MENFDTNDNINISKKTIIILLLAAIITISSPLIINLIFLIFLYRLITPARK
jgi:hypothetical protein